jgi:hypothetical protein
MKKDKRTNKIPVLHRNLMTDKHEPPPKKNKGGLRCSGWTVYIMGCGGVGCNGVFHRLDIVIIHPHGTFYLLMIRINVYMT